MGSGVALFDYDNDGDLDIFLVQGAMLGPHDLSQTVYPPQLPLRGRLYRNDSVRHADGTCTLKFVDVTEESGIRALRDMAWESRPRTSTTTAGSISTSRISATIKCGATTETERLPMSLQNPAPTFQDGASAPLLRF